LNKFISLRDLSPKSSVATLKEELEDMAAMIKEDIFDEDTKDEQIEEINSKIKELEQQIVRVIS